MGIRLQVLHSQVWPLKWGYTLSHGTPLIIHFWCGIFPGSGLTNAMRSRALLERSEAARPGEAPQPWDFSGFFTGVVDGNSIRRSGEVTDFTRKSHGTGKLVAHGSTDDLGPGRWSTDASSDGEFTNYPIANQKWQPSNSLPWLTRWLTRISDSFIVLRWFNTSITAPHSRSTR